MRFRIFTTVVVMLLLSLQLAAAAGTCVTKMGGAVCAGGSACDAAGNAGTCKNTALVNQVPVCTCVPIPPTDVSDMPSVVLVEGSTLSTTVSVGNFSYYAGALGLPIYPTSVTFTLVTLPLSASVPAPFTVRLSSASSDGVSFGPLYWTEGYFQGFSYAGPVSVLTGTLQISEDSSSKLFGSKTVLTLLYQQGSTPNIQVGLPPYLVRQDLTISLGGSGLSVGAVVDRVFLTN